MSVNLKIDGKSIVVPNEYTILKAASENGIYIPRLCFLEGIHEAASCRVCVVEVEGQRSLKNACTMLVTEGMVVRTNTEKVQKSVIENLKLVAANHVFECWRCERERNCELLDLMRIFNVENVYGENESFTKKERVINGNNEAIVLDSGKCVLCGRCISTCEKQTGLSILAFNQRGSKTIVGPAGLNDMDDSGCIYCGKCLQNCPTAAIKEKSAVHKVNAILKDPNKFVVVQAAPAVRAALGEEFGLPIGTFVEGKMFAAFKALGFDEIADVNWGADLTIIEEGYEFIERFKTGTNLPLFTSCSPGWVRYVERYQPEYVKNLSSAKSPHQMSGAMIKHYWAPKLNVDPKNVVVVSIMPCIAKKDESAQKMNSYQGMQDVDYVLTTREIARLIKMHGINFNELEDFAPQGPLAKFTGAATIFGVTGGVMEAALRTVADVLENKTIAHIDYEQVRGIQQIKEATLTIAGKEVNIAVVHGGTAIKKFFEIMKENKKQYHFVEFMGCVGGCVNGGGQPIVPAEALEKCDVRTLRAKALYDQDYSLKIRKSHENKEVMKAYDEFLGKPNSHKAHELLHNHHEPQKIYKNYKE